MPSALAIFLALASLASPARGGFPASAPGPALRGNRTRANNALVNESLPCAKRAADVAHRVHFISGSTQARPWTINVTKNHELFSSLHTGVQYKYVDGSEANSLLDDVYAPQWLKIRVLQDVLRRELMDGGAKADAFAVWIDDDIVVTSPRNFVEAMIQRMSPGAEMLFAADAGEPASGVNTGIILLRVTTKALQMLDDVWAMSAYRVGDATLGTCRNQACLHEQEAVNILRRTSPAFESAAQMVQPVEDDFNINTFYRATHHDPKRRMWVYYDADPEEFRWETRPGLSMCHVTGMEPELRKELIDECLSVAEDAFMREARLQGHPMGRDDPRPLIIA